MMRNRSGSGGGGVRLASQPPTVWGKGWLTRSGNRECAFDDLRRVLDRLRQAGRVGNTRLGQMRFSASASPGNRRDVANQRVGANALLAEVIGHDDEHRRLVANRGAQHPDATPQLLPK